MLVGITGASGVVGSAIVRQLSQQNIKTRSIIRSAKTPGLLSSMKDLTEIAEADVLDMAGLIKAVDGVDAVVHAAGFVSFNPRRKNRIFDINVEGTRNVVNACLVHKTNKLVHISSVAALGKQRPGAIINEDSRWISGSATSDYSHSKYLSELEVYRGQEEGLNVSIVNPSVVLAAGDGQRSSSRLLGYVWRQRPFFTNFKLNYVDARDVAEIVTRILKDSSGEFNGERFIANAGSVPVKKVFQLIAERLKKRAPGIHIPVGLAKAAARLEEIRTLITGGEPVISRQSVRLLREEVVFENAKAKKILGMEFQTLENTLDWCCDDFRTFNINK
ncbi:MAG TPA: NAD-dependent epimerase/dehydratase family protein [Cyclobacteriaceae bacterium]|nr:NAD-dependent epimerase/dehydratase family protein [Cyclobacteriaceae bacterium]